MVSVILIAPPAAGKGTISNFLVETYGYKHISTGELLRNVAKENSEMGLKIKSLLQAGMFVSDEIILPLFKEELLKCNNTPFILDGIPRTIEQANYLNSLFQKMNVDNYAVIHMDIEKEVLEKRAVGRRICPSCKRSYNIFFENFKPKEEGVCNTCQQKLIQREDDSFETFQKRYETYKKETAPLIKYYEQKNKLKTINANLEQEKIIRHVLNIVEVTND